jgi:hypothetical protein
VHTVACCPHPQIIGSHPSRQIKMHPIHPRE